MKRIFIILAFLLSCIGAFATEQLEDILWINDHIWHLGTPPMDFLDEEIIKVILSSPKWTTATEQGKPVRVNYLFNLVFP